MNQAIQYLFVRELICKETYRKGSSFRMTKGLCGYVGVFTGLTSIISFVLILLSASSIWGTFFGFSAIIFVLSVIMDNLAAYGIAKFQKDLDKQLTLLPNLLQQNYTLDDLRKEEAMKTFFPDPPKEEKKK